MNLYEKKQSVQIMCEEALKRVDLALSNHELGIEDDLSTPVLIRVRVQLMKMQEALSAKAYYPTYGRFVVDWPDAHGLVRMLSDLEYIYNRLP